MRTHGLLFGTGTLKALCTEFPYCCTAASLFFFRKSIYLADTRKALLTGFSLFME